MQGSGAPIGMAPTTTSPSAQDPLAPLGPGAGTDGATTTQPAGAGAAQSGQAPPDAAAAAAQTKSMLPTAAMLTGAPLAVAGGTFAARGFTNAGRAAAQSAISGAASAVTSKAAGGFLSRLGSKGGMAGIALAIGGAGLVAWGMGKRKEEQQKSEFLNQFGQYQRVAEQTVAQQEATMRQMIEQQQATGGGQPGATQPVGEQPTSNGVPTPSPDANGGAPSPLGGQEAPIVDVPGGGTGGSGKLIGATIDLAAGAGVGGSQIAEAGSYAIARDIGTFRTLDEANAAVRATMDPETMGTRFLRYAVVQSADGFHAVIARALEGGQARPLTADQGKVVAWNALGHVGGTDANAGWQAYSWSVDAGASSVSVPYGERPFPSGAGVGGATPGAAGSSGAPGPAGSPSSTSSTTGGGGVGAQPPAASGAPGMSAEPRAAFEPRSALGRTFTINATTVDQSIVGGGALQLQGFVSSSQGGFGTADQAAVAARQARASLDASNPYARVVTLQGTDGRFYVYQASVVARETAPLDGAAPMHVFGNGFATYFDGSSSAWQSVADA